MATEILYPQDILIERLRFNPPTFSSPHRKSNPNPKSYRKENRKRSPPPPSSTGKSEPLVSKKSTVPVLGQVTILKRGENLDLKKNQESLKKLFSGDDSFKGKKENLRKSFSGDLQSFASKKNENLKKTFSGDLLLGGNQRLGPDPELVNIRITDLKPLNLGTDVYAGSAFASSPSPRKLPLPKFSMKKGGGFTAAVEESATKDLRRLLRLE
ncbi:hypothetical protein ACHQM5_026885 [Ranunculus cassubicifolius]